MKQKVENMEGKMTRFKSSMVLLVIVISSFYSSCTSRKMNIDSKQGLNNIKFDTCMIGFWEEKEGWTNLLFLNDSISITYSNNDTMHERTNKLESEFDVLLGFPGSFYFWIEDSTYRCMDYRSDNSLVKRFDCDTIVFKDIHGQEILYTKSKDQNTPVYLKYLDTFITISTP